MGSSAKRDGRRGAVQHCHVSTFTVVTGFAQFECTVQLVIGLGFHSSAMKSGANLDRPQIVSSLAREVCDRSTR